MSTDRVPAAVLQEIILASIFRGWSVEPEWSDGGEALWVRVYRGIGKEIEYGAVRVPSPPIPGLPGKLFIEAVLVAANEALAIALTSRRKS